MSRSPTLHTYGPSCIYHAPEAASPLIVETPDPPRARAQFFYLIPFNLDDAFAPLPPVQASQDGSVKAPPQPFVGCDNEELEKAWEDMGRRTREKLVEERKRREEEEAKEKLRQEQQGRGSPIRIAGKAPPDVDVAYTVPNSLDDDGDITSPHLQGHSPRIDSLKHENQLPDPNTFPLRGPPGFNKKQQRASLAQNPYLSRIPRSTPTLSKSAGPNTTDPTAHTSKSNTQLSTFESEKPHTSAVSNADHVAGTESPRPASSAMSSWSSRSRNGSTSGSPFARAPIRHRKFLNPKWSFGDDGDVPDLEDGDLGIAGLSGDMQGLGLGGLREEITRTRSPVGMTGRAADNEPPLHAKVNADESRRGLSSRHDSGATSKKRKKSKKPKQAPPVLSIPVGVSRLYTVHFPSLTLCPIYWDPVGDVAPVIRGTWFYKNTMLPVDPGLANELEKGYTYMRPWTQTWQDELDSCVENGADAEAKIVWALYPEEQGETERQEVAWHKERERSRSTDADSNEHPENQADEATTTKSKRKTRFETNEAAGPEGKKIESNKSFATCSVIYVNSRDAQILRPNLLPSVSRGRRPLSSIRKGREIGIPVVRGFDRKEWDKLHPPKLPATSARRIVRMYQPGRRSSSTHADEEEGRCYGCTLEEHKPRPSDLLLVIHGIGQKLSERVESFHFTHHINAFRRQVNVELNEDSVWPSLRPSMEGIAVLPVNWRAILSREDEDVQALTTDDPNANQFTLKDITPETMPYVRNLISDVMLDIPYYLSHHKQKMNAALVREANRIYRLWCAHNPGFQETGRTHVVAHSLGSVMAVDILSQQPTKLPSDIDFLTSEPSETMFEFDTKSLFLCGSPAGFFLLLNKAALLPRRGRGKPGSEGDDLQKWIAAEEGTYGCLAVDNVYNILHDTDPISYCLNAAVDCDFAATLKPAVVPTSTTSWLQSLGNAFRFSSTEPSKTTLQPPPASSDGPHAMHSQPQQAPTFTSAFPPSGSTSTPRDFARDADPDADPDFSGASLTQLPSNVELETHDFTREEIAERRMFLLNDNGQIDYILASSAGPLSIQYLNMLSAHTSYWNNVDFVRFLVLEVGREPGRRGTVKGLRAAKKTKGYKKGE